ncbi:nicotinate dehydrogenase subunit B [Pseudorhodoferax soli]|uniref:Nicotinate dehydrogenase subunit B n=2 Tax=Pseudorhodoferax soli TaxID=545864 RepID=A0A368YEC1_9BURK|nr:molybdopterin cofactor-binding domain-containing protein [Pseudorhodoferax soli]RCW76534.1 nicotinate dehydrogenase subunit B [Pseudorhodoferax soli]
MRAEEAGLSRAAVRAADGVLLVLREVPPPPAPSPGQPPAVAGNPAEGPEVLLACWDDGSATGFVGHVDLGTGLRTALTQIVAEELDLAPAQVHMQMGNTASVPNQGATIASASIQIHAVPLRLAAAQARAWLQAHGGAAALAGRHVELQLDLQASTKPVEDYRLVGQSVPRVDIPAKVHGEVAFVHDMRVPGMLHGRVVRPPYAGLDAGEFVGNTLEGVDEGSIAHIPGVVAVVVQRDFVGVVAEREEMAEAAMAALAVRWKPWPGMPGVDQTEQALRAHPSTRRLLLEEGQVDQAIAGAAAHMPRTYVWPYQLHASIGPSCALAHWHGEAAATVATVWAGTQNPHVLRADLALLAGVADARIDLVRMEAAGCYGRNGADDVAADALLLSRAVGRPVRVQLTRAQETAWEPKGAAQLMQVDGGLNADGTPAAYDFQTSYPSNGAPTLALLLTRTVEPVAKAFEMGDRTAVPPYAYAHLRVAANDMAPLLRASWLRGVSALPNSFAHESYIDELASAAGIDPVDYRLRHLPDARAAELVRATAAKAGWKPHTAPQSQAADGDILKGQGFAYARYIHSKFPGFGAAWAAWVADVEVNQRTGEVHVRRVVVGQDAGLMVNPAGVQHQVHGNVLQTTSRALKERVEVEPATGVTLNREWGSYPLLSFREVPVVEVMLMPRPGEAPLGAGESASVPGTAAIANAIFDATGVRLRAPPFTPEVVRAALHQGQLPPPPPEPRPEAEAVVPAPATGLPADARLPRRKPLWAVALALVVGGAATVAGLAGWRSAIAPVARPALDTYSAATIERGRLLAAAGDCVVCHTAPSGQPNTGGRAMDTPFGTVYTTNLTPDPTTGIGAWSLAAFQRAMREGISRDGRHLYPAFPYTAFTKMTDDDLTALYAYLMAQPAVAHQPPATQLPFPFGLRPLLAGWNALNLEAGAWKPDIAQTPQWNRGAYLVNGVGHCGACHTPRDALGAERSGTAFLSGALIDGWEAPALTALSKAPVPWTADSLYAYLRHGHSREHGAATGPMAPVVQELAALPDADIRAMALYLASFQAPDAPVRPVATRTDMLPGPAQRLFENACGACHHDGDGPRLLGLNLPFALSTKLHSDRPDNLLRVMLEGVREAAGPQVGFMPGFADNLSDAQIALLSGYLRQRYAPDKPAWQDLASRTAALRTAR